MSENTTSRRSVESCNCKVSGQILTYDQCVNCCRKNDDHQFCRRDAACVYRQSAAISNKTNPPKCPCSLAKTELANRPISLKERCLGCCDDTKFTFNRLISICEMNPDCIINMYKTRSDKGSLLPDIQTENTPENLMIDKNMEASDSDREKNNPRSILIGMKPPQDETAFKKIPLDGESKGNPHPPTSTRLSQWSNRGPSIIWSYYDPEGSIKDTVSPEPDYYPKSTSELVLFSYDSYNYQAPAKGRSWYREIDHEEWRKAQKAPSIITTVTENVPSNLENEPSKAQIIPDSNEQMLHRAADSRESDTKIGGMDDPIPLNIFFNRESALTTSRHTHFKDSVGSRRENLHQPTTKRKSISFAKHVDAPVPTNFGSNGGSELSVLNEVIMLQHGQKNSIDSSTPSVVAERCGRILRFLPWHWKCFKRKKTKNTEGRSHSIRRSLVDNASTGLSVHEHRMKSSIY